MLPAWFQGPLRMQFRLSPKPQYQIADATEYLLLLSKIGDIVLHTTILEAFALIRSSVPSTEMKKLAVPIPPVW